MAAKLIKMIVIGKTFALFFIITVRQIMRVLIYGVNIKVVTQYFYG